MRRSDRIARLKRDPVGKEFMPPTALAALAPHFFQVAYVTPDLAAGEAWFQKLLGVSSFFRMENVTFGPECSFRGCPADSEAHLSLGWLGETQVELIEPVRGDSLYAEFLADHGPGLHHVAFEVPDFEATVSGLSENGLELVMKGAQGPGSQFAYFETAAAGASVVEILGFDDAMRGFMKQLKEQSRAAEPRRS
ncbi:MAG: VOC family protein [Deltaproteobacteria bacterium]|nr:VOC family protein [Deltaproteobacteria bacterium]